MTDDACSKRSYEDLGNISPFYSQCFMGILVPLTIILIQDCLYKGAHPKMMLVKR